MELAVLFFIGLAFAFGLVGGIWWTNHNMKRHPEKVLKLLREAEALRDKARSTFDRKP